MARLPKITVHSWHAEGPAYTIHNRLAGWRNRRARAAGEGDELVGDPESPASSEPHGYLVLARGDDEVWAFNAGYVYELEILVDGDPAVIHVDAREDYSLHRFTHEVQLLARRALTEDELAELLDDIETPTGETPTEETVPEYPEGGTPIWQAPTELEDLMALPPGEVETITVSEAFGAEYGVQPGEWPSDQLFAHLISTGAIEVHAEPTDEELEALTAPDEPSDAGDGAAVGGDAAPAAPEDE